MSLYDDRILSIASLAGFWPLNETTGTTAADISGGGNDGTYTNTPTLGQGPLVYSSDLVDDLSADFEDTNSERVSIGAGIGASLLSGSVGATMELWVNLESLSAGGDVLMTTIVDGTSPGVQLLTFGGGADSFRIRARSEASDANQDLVVPSVITVGDVLHLVGVVDFTAGTSELYVNGVSVGSASGLTFGSATYNPGTPTGVDSIMANHDTTSPADGIASKAALYNTVLSAEDIALNFAAGSADGYDACALDLAPTGYWPLDEATGSAVDRAGSNNGTLVGGVTQGATGGLTNGTDDSETAYTFDGVDDEVNLSSFDSEVFNIGTGDFSAHCWFRSTSGAGSIQQLLSFFPEVGSADRFAISLISAGNIQVSVGEEGSGSAFIDSTSASFAGDGLWHHVALVRGSGVLSMYIDGLLEGTPVAATANINNDIGQDFLIGAGNLTAAPQRFTGDIQKVAVHTTAALTASEVSKLYTAGVSKCGLATLALSPDQYYTMSGTAGEVDASGNGQDAVTTVAPASTVGALTLETPNLGRVYTSTENLIAPTTIADLNVSGFTGSVWFRGNTAAADDLILSYRDSSNDLLHLTNAGGNIGIIGQVRSSGTALTVTPATLLATDNLYHMITLTYTAGGGMNIYVDGVSVVTDSTVMSGTISSSFVGIGAITITGGPPFVGNNANGDLDEAVFFGRTLSPAEVLTLYNCSLATNKFLSGNLIGCPTLEGWTVCAWDLANPGTLLGTDVLDLGTSAAYSIDVGTFSGAIIATSKANQGSVWVANEAVALDALRFPTDPATTPYFFKCTTAGTTGATEPAWVTPVGTTNDNTAVWTVVGELQQPQTQAPLFAV